MLQYFLSKIIYAYDFKWNYLLMLLQFVLLLCVLCIIIWVLCYTLIYPRTDPFTTVKTYIIWYVFILNIILLQDY